jgi:hypothetical protein
LKKKFPTHPANPARICWGWDAYCPADSIRCGNGSDRTQHPFELFGENWRDWGEDYVEKPPLIANASVPQTSDDMKPEEGLPGSACEFPGGNGAGSLPAVTPCRAL